MSPSEKVSESTEVPFAVSHETSHPDGTSSLRPARDHVDRAEEEG